MRTLDPTEIQHISAAGLLAATAAFPVALFVGSSATLMATIGSPIVACQGNGFFDGVQKGFHHISLGLQVGFDIEKAAYHWK